MLASLDAVGGAQVADLFAGSGALGIEALSRGAAAVTFVEADRRAAEVIRGNLAATGLARPGARVIVADVLRWLETPETGVALDLVLADPPYAFTGWAALLEVLGRGRLAAGAVVALETGTAISLGPGWEVLREKRYGSSVVVLARPDRTGPSRKGDT